MKRATSGYQKLQVLARFRVEGRKLQIREVFAGLPRVVSHAPRGRETSYSSYFLSKGHPWPWLSPRGCLGGFSNANNAFSGFPGMNRSTGWSSSWM